MWSEVGILRNNFMLGTKLGTADCFYEIDERTTSLRRHPAAQTMLSTHPCWIFFRDRVCIKWLLSPDALIQPEDVIVRIECLPHLRY